MKTYVTVSVSSDGGLASEITEILIDMGFNTTIGGHDFVYDWGSGDVTADQVIAFVDKVQGKLRGKNVRLHFDTIK